MDPGSVFFAKIATCRASFEKCMLKSVDWIAPLFVGVELIGIATF